MKSTKIILLFPILFALQGCVAFMVAAGAAGASSAGYFTKHVWGAKPKMVYAIESNDIVMSVSTYSSNLGSIQEMTILGAAIVASQKRDCDYLAPTFNTWPKSTVILTIKVKAIATYQCVERSGSTIDVHKLLEYEAKKIQLIRDRNLLTAADPNVEIDRSATPSESTQSADTGGRTLVLSIQRRLNALGYKAGKADGLMGNNTRNAIVNFQTDNNLPATGEPTESLLKAITERL